MNFQKILKQVATENNTTPEDVYREMQIALADAYSHKDDTQESQALWKEMGFDMTIFQILRKEPPELLHPETPDRHYIIFICQKPKTGLTS